MLRRSVVWFRLDLRLHDNEALTDALKGSDEVIPVYVFDRRLFEDKTRFGFPRTGIHRSRFLLQSVINLRERLRARGSELIVRYGIPEDILFDLADQYKTSWIFCNRERTRDEVMVQDRLEKKLWSIGQEMRFSRGKMLYYTQDLPFPVTHTPDAFSNFRKEVEHYTPIRTPLPIPDDLKFTRLPVDAGMIPTLSDLGFSQIPNQESSNFPGGEESALTKLKSYFWINRDLEHYAKTRNELIDANGSSRFSPWISHGCLSPKYIHQEMVKIRDGNQSSSAADKFFQQLLWRDYHRLMGKKYENKIFLKGGTKEEPRKDLTEDHEKFKSWVTGDTGVPLIDACMHQLSETGYLSRRGRELVSGFLVNDMKINWQMGADYFESILIDYDPCSNYGNWNLMAGVGAHNRKDLHFNMAAQARRLDPKGDYIRRWTKKYQRKSCEELHQMHEAL